MANFPITNHAVFPTAADINGGVPGNGTVWTEMSAALLFRSLSLFVNRVEMGFDPPATGGTLTKSIPGGEALISGRRVKGTAANNVTFDASATNHLYLQLLLDANGLVTGIQLVTNTTGTKPANSCKIAQVTTNASSVTAVVDQRPQGRIVWGVFHGGSGMIEVGSSDWTVSGAVITFLPAFLHAPVVFALPISTTGRHGIRCEARTASTVTLQAFDEAGSETNINIMFFALA